MVATSGASITGHAVWHPATVLDNDELCAAFNAYVHRTNAAHAAEIAAGTRAALLESTPDWIVRASGIRRRYVEDKTGLVDPDRMCPNIFARPDDQLALQAEYAVNAARAALAAAALPSEAVDLIVLGSSNLQRMYPTLAIEVQHALGTRGHGFDVSAGCSAGTTAVQLAAQAIRTGDASCALVVVPELTTPQMNWRDRDSHFLFGDAAVAVIVEPAERARPGSWDIVSARAMTRWSNNIRNGRGYVDRCDPAFDPDPHAADQLFRQHGRRVVKDVILLAARFLTDHIIANDLTTDQIGRFWLHQANAKLNQAVMARIAGRGSGGASDRAPLILDEFGNTAAAGSLIAFSRHADAPAGSYGLIASFGAGYSLVSLLLQRR